MKAAQDALLIFAKYPRLGQVKTRLGKGLSERRCLRLHEAFLGDVVERTRPLAASRFLFLAGATAEERRALAERLGDVGVRAQRGDDLGARMGAAYDSLGGKFRGVAFIGADSPDLPLKYLEEAFAELGRHAVVIGPSEDGGYYLLGLAEPRPALFQGIRWGSDQVLRQTLERIPEGQAHLLPPWYDVDRPGDLERLARRLPSHPAAGFPRRTARLLKHWNMMGGSSE